MHFSPPWNTWLAMKLWIVTVHKVHYVAITAMLCSQGYPPSTIPTKPLLGVEIMRSVFTSKMAEKKCVVFQALNRCNNKNSSIDTRKSLSPIGLPLTCFALLCLGCPYTLDNWTSEQTLLSIAHSFNSALQLSFFFFFKVTEGAFAVVNEPSPGEYCLRWLMIVHPLAGRKNHENGGKDHY